MPIQYAEVTIIMEPNMFRSVSRLFGNEPAANSKDTIIISFDEDGFVCDTKNTCKDGYLLDENGFVCDKKKEEVCKSFTMGPISFHRIFPLYFYMDDSSFFLKKATILHDGMMKMDFKPIFANNSKFATNNKIPSIYNCIYLRGGNEVFSSLKMKSNEENPRFFLAYEDSCFTRNDIIYLVNYIFKQQFK